MKKTYWIILGIVVLTAGGFWYFSQVNKTKKVKFGTAQVDRGDIEVVISGSGTLGATNTVDVGTQVSGVIEKVSVDFNDQVKKGQMIAQIDARNLRSTVQQAKANVLQAELQYEQKKRAYEFAQKYNSENGKDLTIVEAEAALEQVRAQMELSERNFERYKELFEKGVVARVEYEAKESEYKGLKASFDSANAMLNRTKANVSNVDISKSSDDLKNARALLLSAKADLEKAMINLNYAIITTPIDGVVISRNVEVGQTVAATFSTPVLFTIANDLTKMEIEASIDEADVGMIKVGQPVIFTVDAYVDEEFEGIVEQIRLQPQVVANVVTYTAIVSTNNESLKLMPGMTANLDITTSQRKDILRVPVMALNFTPPKEYIEPWRTFLEETMSARTGNRISKNGVIWKVENNTLVPKKIELGLSDGGFTEIVSKDFVEGDQVVIGLNDSEKSSDVASNPFLPSRPGAKKE